ncbi:hypothetical protein HNY73_005381 [Argiope bruennichi]|uniref:Uncharacterized protein n=1 Tax=Argiope bruennichi TaxID=94029 RepID=A0A8T0FJF4_ARGBR|nr:hypothetical protein HNY73_005381 [Argiope bruennichi]
MTNDCDEGTADVPLVGNRCLAAARWIDNQRISFMDAPPVRKANKYVGLVDAQQSAKCGVPAGNQVPLGWVHFLPFRSSYLLHMKLKRVPNAMHGLFPPTANSRVKGYQRGPCVKPDMHACRKLEKMKEVPKEAVDGWILSARIYPIEEDGLMNENQRKRITILAKVTTVLRRR